VIIKDHLYPGVFCLLLSNIQSQPPPTLSQSDKPWCGEW
jgi:hypothetical protein